MSVRPGACAGVVSWLAAVAGAVVAVAGLFAERWSWVVVGAGLLVVAEAVARRAVVGMVARDRAWAGLALVVWGRCLALAGVLGVVAVVLLPGPVRSRVEAVVTGPGSGVVGLLPAGVQEAVARLAQVGSPAGWVGLACVVLVGAVVAVRAAWSVVVAAVTSRPLGRAGLLRAGCAGRGRMRGERDQQAGPGYEGDL